jgi:dolichyl-phosphate-mannose--protein O-mannosyl transferase
MVSTISAFGNPIVWVVTPFASLYCLWQGIRRKKLFHLFVALGWLSSYLPWVMVTRLCFIYHYFPCAMFGIVAMAMMATDAVNRWPEFKKYMWVYIALCAVMFVIFLPVTTGITTPKAYIEALEIMPQWYFVN